MLNETIINKINKKKNNNVEFKQKKKKLISFEIVMTTKKKMMIEKEISIESNDFQMFKTFDVKNLIERISTKLVINNTTSFSNFFKILSSDFEKFLK